MKIKNVTAIKKILLKPNSFSFLNSIKSIYIVFFLTSFSVSFCIYLREGEKYIAHPKLVDQVFVLLVISAVLALVQIIKMQVYIRFFLLTIQGIIIFIIGYSFGESLIIEVQLMSLFLYAVQMNFSDFSKYFLSIVYLFIFITLQGSRNIYGEIFPGPDVSLVISSVIILLFVIIIADIHTRLIDRNRHLVESAKQLEDSLLKITRANINYQDYVSIAQTNAASEERLRITRDLHDALGYAFSNILLLGRLNLKMYDKDDNIHLNLEKICQISQSGIQECGGSSDFLEEKIWAS